MLSMVIEEYLLEDTSISRHWKVAIGVYLCLSSWLDSQSLRNVPLMCFIYFKIDSTDHTSRVSSGDGIGEEDLEAQVEAFMQKQAEVESGQSTRMLDPNKVLGEDEVSEDDAKAYCREIVQVMKTLKQNRDMTVNEIRLTISIEDPRAREQRLMGIEDSRGVSRDEMAAALEVVAEGQVPLDRIALRELHREMVNWPFLEVDGTKTTGELTCSG